MSKTRHHAPPRTIQIILHNTCNTKLFKFLAYIVTLAGIELENDNMNWHFGKKKWQPWHKCRDFCPLVFSLSPPPFFFNDQRYPGTNSIHESNPDFQWSKKYNIPIGFTRPRNESKMWILHTIQNTCAYF